MRAAARAVWHRFSEPLEGRVQHMYGDVYGYVTTAVGLLLPSAQSAVALPWLRPDGSRASAEQVRGAWHAVADADPEMRRLGGAHQRWQRLTDLRLSSEAIDRAVEAKLDQNDLALRTKFGPGWPEWPADAHLALHSWAWAVGPAARFPRLTAALRGGRFDEASREVDVKPNIGTIVERNRRNRTLLRNAWRVREDLLDPEVLIGWDRDLEDETPTLTEVPDPPSEHGRVLRMTGTREAVREALEGRDDEPDDVA